MALRTSQEVWEEIDFLLMITCCEDTLIFSRATVTEWQHSLLPDLRSEFGSRPNLKWESW